MVIPVRAAWRRLPRPTRAAVPGSGPARRGAWPDASPARRSERGCWSFSLSATWRSRLAWQALRSSSASAMPPRPNSSTIWYLHFVDHFDLACCLRNHVPRQALLALLSTLHALRSPSLPFLNRRVMLLRQPDELGLRADEHVIGVLLDDVRAPPGDAAGREHGRELIHRDADIVQHGR